MADSEVVEKPEIQIAEADQGCPVRMYKGRVCGRHIYSAPPGVDEEPVCLMHSKDPNKNDAAFQEEFDRILRDAGEGDADFTRFVFQRSNYAGREFRAKCSFLRATFTQRAEFSQTTFTQSASFIWAAFRENAYFYNSTFMQDASFNEATFMQRSIFVGATFMQAANFFKVTFTQNTYFRRVMFTMNAAFYGAIFAKKTRFGSATFTMNADFRRATFKQRAGFREVTFRLTADFSGAIFAQDSDFRSATFTDDANFSGATFGADAHFRNSTFAQAADFSKSTFIRKSHFDSVVFKKIAYFRAVTFTQKAYFSKATFEKDANFRGVAFAQNAYFSGATFAQNAYFRGVTFAQVTYFSNTTFLQRAEFSEMQFREDQSPDLGLIFGSARFENPTLVQFYKTYLGLALFHNCDVSKFEFSTVRWRRRGNGQSMVFEEDVELGHPGARALEPEANTADERNYRLISEIYQQLKKNYDDRKDYSTAGDFHYGEMEMKRLATPHPNVLSRWVAGKVERLLACEKSSRLALWAKRKGYSERSIHVFRREWHRHVGLCAWYKYASEYGESYNRPLLWLLGALLFFTLLYPVLGLQPALKAGGSEGTVHEPHPREGEVPGLNYRNFIRYASFQPGGEELGYFSLIGHSLMTSVGVAALQRDLAYEPTYPWGRALSWLELALTSTLIALFLLAVRRQFRR